MGVGGTEQYNSVQAYTSIDDVLRQMQKYTVNVQFSFHTTAGRKPAATVLFGKDAVGRIHE